MHDIDYRVACMCTRMIVKHSTMLLHEFVSAWFSTFLPMDQDSGIEEAEEEHPRAVDRLREKKQSRKPKCGHKKENKRLQLKRMEERVKELTAKSKDKKDKDNKSKQN